MKRKGILIVVSGFSGSGKGTLMKKMLETYDNYALSISMTTRSPREGEVDGREYFFTNKEDFEQKISENQLIEYACYCENYYGTPKEYVEKKLAEGMDVCSFQTVRRANGKVHFVDAQIRKPSAIWNSSFMDTQLL